MKTKHPHLNRLCVAFLAGAALLGSAAGSRAQTLFTSWTNTFDAAANATSFFYWYDLGGATNYPGGLGNMVWDSTMNDTNAPAPTSGAGSGALLFLSPWVGITPGLQPSPPYNPNTYLGQNLVVGSFSEAGNYSFSQTIDGSKYDSFSFGLYVDPASPLDRATNVCVLSVGFFVNNYSTYTITNITIPTNNMGKWIYYTCPIDKTTVPQPGDNGTNAPRLPAGLMFNINCYGGGENASLFAQTNPTRMWVDNMYLKLSAVLAPPPTLFAPVSVHPGLNITPANTPSDQYQRDQLELIQNTGTGFVGQQGMTYSFTIASFPPTNFSSYQAHIFLTTGPSTPASLDYNATNLVWLNVQENAGTNGGATGYFRYKVNEPNSNTNVFGTNWTGISGLDGSTQYAGTLAALGASTVLGTWGMTFNNDTNITLFGPGGVSTNITIANQAATNFIEPINVCFGAQPNTTAVPGQDVILANAEITNSGSGTLIVYDNFLTDTVLNTAVWTILVNELDTVQLYPNDPAQKLVEWTTPDGGYGLQTTPSLNKPISWTTLSGPDTTIPSPAYIFTRIPGRRSALVPGADLANTNQAFFRLNGQSFVQLQVLMPGETNAPGTLTGKTGSPTSESLSTNQPFNITINACDSNWTIITSASDTVHITSSDSMAALPPDSPLFGGTAVLSFSFGQTGTWTVTASDVTVPTIKSNTSSPTLVTP